MDKHDRIVIVFAFDVISVLITNVTLSLTSNQKLSKIDGSLLTRLNNCFHNSEDHSPILEPLITWHHHSPDYVNASIVFYSTDPLYLIKTFEILIPESKSPSDVLLTHEDIKERFYIYDCTSGVVIYRKFLSLNIHGTPLALNVSLIQNRKQ